MAVTAVTRTTADVTRTTVALFPKAQDVQQGVKYLSGAVVGGVLGFWGVSWALRASQVLTAVEHILGEVLEPGEGAFGGGTTGILTATWNEEIRLLQEDAISIAHKVKRQREQMLLAITQEMRAATSRMEKTDVSEVSTRQRGSPAATIGGTL
ncbi:hypothetical protein ColTof4_14373 [Colletotrichum tofieldiae]|nr:hypothetical protein ColTof3_14783 [Colletotrichum tofieldiae]GKT81950.1 hypothetical protein ColTof4_14373 [Colletotrichum tofieldiae]